MEGGQRWALVCPSTIFVGMPLDSRIPSSKAKMTTTAVWARLPELPIELYDSRLLTRIGNQLGTLLKIDAHTMDNQ